jgi:hypothetical protein
MDIERASTNAETAPRCNACGGFLNLFSQVSFREYGDTPRMPDVMYFRCENCDHVKIVKH